MRLVGTAYYANDGSDFGNRGGIIAHQIGYGKTVVIIALLEIQRHHDRSASIIQRQETATRLWGDSPFIHLQATLIIVPDHITLQWRGEFAKFASPDLEILLIRNYAHWLRTSLADLCAADVIILSTSTWTVSYETARNRMSLSRETGSQTARERADRYRDFCQRVRAVVAEYNALDGGEEGERLRAANRFAEDLVDREERAYQTQKEEFVTGSRRKGQNGPAGGNKKRCTGRKGEEDKAGGEEAVDGEEPELPHDKSEAGGKILWSPTRFLENFSFARVVLDEFSYSKKPDVFPFFTNAFASGKWLLSGTPRLGALADITDLAGYLQIHVARPDPCVRSDLDPITKGPVVDPTAAGERIRLHAANLRSCDFALGRHRAAESFVRHFLRADRTDRACFEVVERVRPIRLPLRARLVYHGAEFELSLARDSVFHLPLEVRRALGMRLAGRLSEGRALAERFLVRQAALPVPASTVVGVRDAAFRLASLNTAQAKSFCDKLYWLAARADRGSALVPASRQPEHKRKLGLVRRLMEAFVAAHRRLSRGDGQRAEYRSFGGKAYGLELLGALYPAPGRVPAGPFEAWWAEFRGAGARFFWPDWFVLDEGWLEGEATVGELVELSTEAVLFARTHPAGRAVVRAADDDDEGWLLKHVGAVRTVMEASMTGDVLSGRDDPTADGPTTEEVEGRVADHTGEELVAFLKACISARKGCTDALLSRAGLADLGKADLQDRCAGSNLRYTDLDGVETLKRRLAAHFGGLSRPADYADGRAFHVRTALPIPGRMVLQDQGRNEAVLEEITSTYQQLDSCQQDLVEACRRRNLYSMINGAGEVELPASETAPACHGCSESLAAPAGWAGSVVVACGHWLCAGCKGSVRAEELAAPCPVVDCGAFCRLSPIIPLAARDFRPRRDPEDIKDEDEDEEDEETGEVDEDKLAHLVKLVVEEIPAGDKVVVFTTFAEMAEELDRRLRARGVTTLSLIGAGKGAGGAAKTEAFKKGKARVLLLDPTDEHAAGSNLTIANHIAFVSPGMEPDAYTRHMHHQQGIGRCLRPGQLKTVYIYNLMTEGTVDERLLRGLSEERASVAAEESDPVVEYFRTAPLPWWLVAEPTTTTEAAAALLRAAPDDLPPSLVPSADDASSSAAAVPTAGVPPPAANICLCSVAAPAAVTVPPSVPAALPPPFALPFRPSNRYDPDDPMDDLYD